MLPRSDGCVPGSTAPATTGPLMTTDQWPHGQPSLEDKFTITDDRLTTHWTGSPHRHAQANRIHDRIVNCLSAAAYQLTTLYFIAIYCVY